MYTHILTYELSFIEDETSRGWGIVKKNNKYVRKTVCFKMFMVLKIEHCAYAY